LGMAAARVGAAVSGAARRGGAAFVDFWKRLGNDYMVTFKGAVDTGKEKPYKFVVAGVSTVTLAVAYATCPDERSMLDELRERRQQMALIPASEHSRKTDAELSLRTLLLNQRRLEHYNMLFFSLLVRRQHDTDVRLYRSQDPNLNSWWITDTLKNVMDIGAFGKWFHLERAFIDHDINEEEEFPAEG
ncbi:hypothetical protein PFISCL1PPCAC_22805, partial [Pristionchus fissidentatus]